VQVARWRRRYAEGRLAAIERDLPRGCRKLTIDAQAIVHMTGLICKFGFEENYRSGSDYGRACIVFHPQQSADPSLGMAQGEEDCRIYRARMCAGDSENLSKIFHERLGGLMSSQEVLCGGVAPPAPERVYSNQGNPPLIDLLGKSCKRLLDIGCGAGDNAALVKSRYSECDLFGITHSATEAELAQRYMNRCWVFDIEGKLPDDLAHQSFDALIFSHVLEHLRDPAVVLARFSQLLRSGGQALIAVPNVLSWRMRVQFLLGRFEYESVGVLDDTHLRFFTYFTADQHLLSKSPDLKLTNKVADGSVPLWWLRRHVFSRRWTAYIDQWGCRHWPNLFGGQVLIRAVKQ